MGLGVAYNRENNQILEKVWLHMFGKKEKKGIKYRISPFLLLQLSNYKKITLTFFKRKLISIMY